MDEALLPFWTGDGYSSLNSGHDCCLGEQIFEYALHPMPLNYNESFERLQAIRKGQHTNSFNLNRLMAAVSSFASVPNILEKLTAKGEDYVWQLTKVEITNEDDALALIESFRDLFKEIKEGAKQGCVLSLTHLAAKACVEHGCDLTKNSRVPSELLWLVQGVNDLANRRRQMAGKIRVSVGGEGGGWAECGKGPIGWSFVSSDVSMDTRFHFSIQQLQEKSGDVSGVARSVKNVLEGAGGWSMSSGGMGGTFRFHQSESLTPVKGTPDSTRYDSAKQAIKVFMQGIKKSVHWDGKFCVNVAVKGLPPAGMDYFRDMLHNRIASLPIASAKGTDLLWFNALPSEAGKQFSLETVGEVMQEILLGNVEGKVTFNIPKMKPQRKKELEEYLTYLSIQATEKENAAKNNKQQAGTGKEKEKEKEKGKKKGGFFSRLLKSGGQSSSKPAKVKLPPGTPLLNYSDAEGLFVTTIKWAKYLSTPPYASSSSPSSTADSKKEKEKEKEKEKREKEENRGLYGLVSGCFSCAEMRSYRGNYDAPHILFGVCPMHTAILLSEEHTPFPGKLADCPKGLLALLSPVNMSETFMFGDQDIIGQSTKYGSLCDPDWFGEFFPGLRLGKVISYIWTWTEMDLNDYWFSNNP